MNVIEFPVGRLEKRRASAKLIKAGFKPCPSKIFELGAALETSYEGNDRNVLLNPNEISHVNLLKFIERFPCFMEMNAVCAYEILDSYLGDRLCDAQDRAVEGILELTSSYNFGFSIVDAFEIWSSGDRQAYLSMLTEYSAVLN